MDKPLLIYTKLKMVQAFCFYSQLILFLLPELKHPHISNADYSLMLYILNTEEGKYKGNNEYKDLVELYR